MQFQYLGVSLGLKHLWANDRSSNIYAEGILTASICRTLLYDKHSHESLQLSN